MATAFLLSVCRSAVTGDQHKLDISLASFFLLSQHEFEEDEEILLWQPCLPPCVSDCGRNGGKQRIKSALISKQPVLFFASHVQLFGRLQSAARSV